jgi:hypothetical protein
VRRLGQQVQRRQGAARRVEEQRRLTLLLGPRDGLGRHRHHDFDGFDADRAFLDLAPLGFHHLLALFGHRAAITPVLPAFPQAAKAEIRALDQGPRLLGRGDPRHAGEQAEADHAQHQQDQRAAGVTEEQGDEAPDFVAEHAARFHRQRRLAAPEAHGFEAAACQQEHEKSGQGDQQRAAVAAEQVAQAVIAPRHQEKRQHHPPPGGDPEQVQQEIAEPCAEASARVGDAFHGRRVRPARIGAIEPPQHQRQVESAQADQQPARLMHQQGKFFRQWGRSGVGGADGVHGVRPARGRTRTGMTDTGRLCPAAPPRKPQKAAQVGPCSALVAPLWRRVSRRCPRSCRRK